MKIYRWIVFLLAAGYSLRMLIFSSYDSFGGPLRFLTVWALFCSFFAASRMMALVEGRSDRRWDGFVSMTAVVNAMVVYLYWSLFLNDPSSVTRDGKLGEPYLELYLHALGPLLQWIDAVFIHRSFRRMGPALLWLFGIISTYIAWIELIVSPMNDSPVGPVTTGLPYPFLNGLPIEGRAIFYGTNFAAAIVFLLAFAAATWAVRKYLPRSPQHEISDDLGTITD